MIAGTPWPPRYLFLAWRFPGIASYRVISAARSPEDSWFFLAGSARFLDLQVGSLHPAPSSVGRLSQAFTAEVLRQRPDQAVGLRNGSVQDACLSASTRPHPKAGRNRLPRALARHALFARGALGRCRGGRTQRPLPRRGVARSFSPSSPPLVLSRLRKLGQWPSRAGKPDARLVAQPLSEERHLS